MKNRYLKLTAWLLTAVLLVTLLPGVPFYGICGNKLGNLRKCSRRASA